MRQDQAKTKSRNLKQPIRQDAINWVSKARYSISPDTLIKSFKVCGISNALNGTEDDMISDDLPSVDSEPKIKRVRVMVMREIHVLLRMMLPT